MSLARHASVGLPSNPRTRSFTQGPPRQNIPSRPPSSASERPPPSSYHFSAAPPLPSQPRTLRTQRSIGSIPVRPSAVSRSRSLDRSAESRHAYRSEPPPPLPSLPRGPRIDAAQPRGRAPAPPRVHASSRSEDYGGSRKPEDLMSDSGYSSPASEGFGRSPGSASSSRTSMDEIEMDDKGDEKPPAGFGSSLWGSITGVASNLTISVSKAWSTNVASYSGEETPVGGESRLTRAMKAYHIEKARNPGDLPDSLFDERERGLRSRTTPTPGASGKKTTELETRPAALPHSVTTDMDRQDDARPPLRITRGPTLADRKASSVSSVPSVRVPRAGSEEHVTKSMARLRELRDAKRGAKVRFDDGETEVEAESGVREIRGRSDPVARPAPHPEPERKPFRGQERMPPPTRPRGNMPAPLGASLGIRGRQPVGLPSGVHPVRS
ncbi:hypothetical protein GSI_13669 [Ganoderma sinense ZZ0214-1]|uniref:Uncharacterized protein n=1 Tax=Ganoderma sinense ZZ0214-1 TaxID=1077348 RepID=A0A2G8RRF2_9APHY|nr:hypothetical protein GSI_13669 [Ganoderma sinense ZZ0214-1]